MRLTLGHPEGPRLSSMHCYGVKNGPEASGMGAAWRKHCPKALPVRKARINVADSAQGRVTLKRRFENVKKLTGNYQFGNVISLQGNCRCSIGGLQFEARPLA